MRYTTITAGELRKLHGTPCTFKTNEGVVCEGKISVDKSGRVYVAHSNKEADGWKPSEMFEYKYGWNIYFSIEDDSYSSNRNLNWIEIDTSKIKLPKDFGKMKNETKPKLVVIQNKKVKYSDDDTTYEEGNITLDGKYYTPEELTEHIKKARRVLDRYKKISF